METEVEVDAETEAILHRWKYGKEAKEAMTLINTENFAQVIKTLAIDDPEIFVKAEDAIEDSMIGLRLFDEPLIGFADADNPGFQRMKSAEVVGPLSKLPQEFLPNAKSVISIFFPFSEAVRTSNYGTPQTTGSGWLHGRIEGQAFLGHFDSLIIDLIEAQGGKAIAPALDERNKIQIDFEGKEGGHTAQSCWSERHVAYIAGLGTFSLTRSLITKRGSAGRFCSVITTLPVDHVTRPDYAGVYDWCTRCGQCIQRCPVHAISLEHGKDQRICAGYVMKTKEFYAPRYGCGKCQTEVPCETSAPGYVPASQ